MKYSFITLLALALVSCGNKTGNPDAVKFELMSVSEYCGGAEPTEELLQQLSIPKPYSDTLFVHADNDVMREKTPVLLIFKNGKAELTGMGPGCYFGFDSKKIYRDSIEMMTEYIDCKVMHNNIPMYIFNIYEDTRLLQDTVMLRCDPCELPRP